MLNQVAFCSIEDDIFYLNPDGTKYNENSSNYPKIDEFEMRLFEKKYTAEPIEIRLNRIENKIFRRISNGVPLTQRMSKISMHFDRKDISQSDFAMLNKIEKKVFGLEQEDDMQARIERLEVNVFGMFQDGDYKKRISLLSKATLKEKVKEQQYQPFYPYGPVKKSFMNKFKGTMTGYTLPTSQQYCQIPQPTHTYNNYNSNSYPQIPNYQRYQNPYQAYTREQMQKVHQNYDSFFGKNVYNNDFQEMFSADVADEIYNEDGTFRKYKSKSKGGVGVKIIRD